MFKGKMIGATLALLLGCSVLAPCRGLAQNSTALGWQPWEQELISNIDYTVNNGTQQNVRMRLDGTTNTYVAGGLKIGDVVRYSFTYWDTARNYAVDTALQTYTMQ